MDFNMIGLIVAVASAIFALLSLVVTVVALAVSAHAVKEAQRAAAQTKMAERAMLEEARVFSLLKTANGMGDAVRVRADGTAITDYSMQMMAIALLSQYASALPGLEAFRTRLIENRTKESRQDGRDVWQEMLDAVERSIAVIKSQANAR